MLDIPDRYEYSGYKERGLCRWALLRGFKFVFSCTTDTFVALERLLASGFEEHDYCGTTDSENTFVGGGPGYWKSRKAVDIVANSPVSHWAADFWVGKVLRERGVAIHKDSRYTNLEETDPPLKINNVISSHIANSPAVYRPEQMLELYRRYKG